VPEESAGISDAANVLSAGAGGLRAELLKRAGDLADGDSIDIGAKIAHFPEIQAGFEVEGFRTRLIPRGPMDPGSKLTLGGGGSLLVTGLLHTPLPDSELVAIFKRRLQFEDRWAIHEYLEVKPPFRGRGINLRLLQSSFALYEALGLDSVHLKASLATGRWHWARVGFEFHRAADLAAVRDWAVRVCDALELKEPDLPGFSSAAQIVRMGGDCTTSFAQMSAAMPGEEKRLRSLASENGLDPGTSIPLGRAVMLSGPDWMGRLELNGPSRVAFDIYASTKGERLRNANSG
jgi:GNAT superfamily N-acetyltransferase